MSARSFGFTLFTIFVLVLLYRDRSTHNKTLHTPVQPVKLSTDQSSRPYYTTGPIRKVTLPKVPIAELFTRKKIDNFIFNHYNHYKLQFTFIDLGYASNFMFSFFSEQYPYFKITEKIGFDLSQPMLDGTLNLDIHKKSFNLTVRQYLDENLDQTITTFNLSFIRKQSNVNANLTHILRNKQCFTAIRRTNIVSHKCYGGIGSGKVKIQRIIREEDNQQSKKQNNMLNLALNITRTVYDGLRGSGMHWRWVWGLMSGFSKPEFYDLNHTIPISHWLGLNIGHIFDEGEDFAFLNGKIIPIKGLKYQFDEKVQVGTNIIVTATKPRLKATFTVLKKVHQFEDLGVIKLDMVKLLGNWAGQIQDEEQGRDFGFYQISGMIQSCDSLF